MTLSKRSNRNIIFDAIRRVRKGYSLPAIPDIACELQSMGRDDINIREVRETIAFMQNRQLEFRKRRKQAKNFRRGQLAELLGMPGTSAPKISS